MRDRQCALNHEATESLSLSQTDHGRLVYITCIPTTCCGEIFQVHDVEIAHVTLTTPTYETLITRLRLCMGDPCTKFEVSSISRYGEITRGVKF